MIKITCSYKDQTSWVECTLGWTEHTHVGRDIKIRRKDGPNFFCRDLKTWGKDGPNFFASRLKVFSTAVLYLYQQWLVGHACEPGGRWIYNTL